jgi:uncharacterized protein YqfB (UPF0267 family)
LAIRTYAAAWIAKGGKYDCADLCDTTYSQVYQDATYPKTNDAVDATKGLAIAEQGQLVFAEYSAENGDPTKFAVSDPVCAGKTLYGHGRGMCQWGSQRWAQQGKDHGWIAEHYYPGSTVVNTVAPLPGDGGAPVGDGPVGPGSDVGPQPPPDGSLPPDVGLPPGTGDAGVRYEAGSLPPLAGDGDPSNKLSGGCSVGRPSTATVSMVLASLLILLALCRRFRRGTTSFRQRIIDRARIQSSRALCGLWPALALTGFSACCAATTRSTPARRSTPQAPRNELRFSQSLCDRLASGEKRITLRDRHRRQIKPSDVVTLSCLESGRSFCARVTSVRHTTWAEVSVDELRDDGFRERADLLPVMRRFYPGIKATDPATVYRWVYLACPTAAAK